MEAKNIMTKKLLTAPVGTELFEAYDLMKENDIRHLPILGANKIIVGILSDRDLQRAMVVTDNGVFDQAFRFKEGDKVEHFMSWPVLTVSQESEISFVAQQMLNNKISSLLMTDEEGQVRGIVTVDDMLRYLTHYTNTNKRPLKLNEFLSENCDPEFRTA